MRIPVILFLLLCLVVQFQGSTCIISPSKPLASFSSSSASIAVQFGDNISPVVSNFITSLLNNVTNNTIQIYPANVFLNASSYSTVFSFGNTETRNTIVPQSELDELGSEGYIIRSIQIEGVIYLIGDGNKILPDIFNNNQNISNGAHYSAFRMMEILGFPFFHPLKIIVPAQLNNFTVPLNVTEKPYWPIRGWHYHTQHLLELTDMFNGFGLNGVDDQEGWESFLPHYQSFLLLEWLLLCADEWVDFCDSTTRQERQLILTNMARAVGVGTGADVPIAEEQQHAWRMISNFTNPQIEIEQLQDRIDWLVAAGFDFISTENGFSEFTHPNDISMVGWMNASVSYVEEKYGKKMYIKCHCSSGQVASDYTDPWTGQKLNFNFLPIESDSRLGVYPHTVQSYRLDDPAPTYGNVNFEYMFEFLINVSGSREVVYYGETDYWVNYDIDVPLFYPMYGDSRIYDLRKIAFAQQNSTHKMQGQMNFDSGWEWGSWIQDTLTARAVWNPHLEIDNQSDALAQALEPITSIFGEYGSAISTTLQDLISYQRQYLVLGLVNGTAPKNITNLNGQAYLQGWDTWSEVGTLGSDTSTQPTKYSFLDVRDPFHNDRYWDEVEPLLAEMDASFGEIADQLESYRNQVPTWTLDLYDDIVDSSRMLAVRAAHVHALYDYAAGYLKNKTWRAERLEVAQMSMITAQKVIANRESKYRIDVHVVAGWRPNPTCYSYGYLWTVHSLYYFWRDYEKAIDASLEAALSPCFMNIINPVDVGFGEGILFNVTAIAYQYFEKYKWTDFFSTCLVAPSTEPQYGPI